MAWLVLGVKGEKWPCAIKMKLEKVLALSLVISFFPPSTVVRPLTIIHFDPLLSISCSGSRLSLPTHPWSSSSTEQSGAATLCVAVWLVLHTNTEGMTGSARLSNMNRKHPLISSHIAVSPRRYYFWYTKADSSNLHALILMAACCLQDSLQQKGPIYSPRDTLLHVPD